MALLEILTLKLAPALAKSILKLWLPANPVAIAAGDTVLDILKGQGEVFATADATDRLFRNLSAEVARRLDKVVAAEFSGISDADKEAAILTVADVFYQLDLSHALMQADLNAVGLHEIAKPTAQALFAPLSEDALALAQLILKESCAYAVAIATKLPDFQMAATRELLQRTSDLSSDLTRVLTQVAVIREQGTSDALALEFETQYRRVIAQRLDRMQLFGIRFVGAGAREPEISIAYVTLGSSRPGKAQARDVDLMLTDLSRVVVRGEAGSGKTTLLRWLAIQAARRSFGENLRSWNRCVPFFVPLREYAERPFPSSQQFVAAVAPNVAAAMPTGWAHQVLSTKALLLIDGIDEIPTARRAELAEWLRGLVEEYPNAAIITSSRPAALEARLARSTMGDALVALHFEQITLEPMSVADSETLISQWHSAVARDLTDEDSLSKVERYERDLVRALYDRPALRALAANPLLCSMVCVLNWDRQQRLPDSRMQLYELALEMLIDARDAERGIRAAQLQTLDRSAKETLLDGIAYWMMRNGVTEANFSDVEAQVSMALQRMPSAPQAAGNVLQELLERTGVLRQPQAGSVDFIHRTFLEYMAARAAIRAGDIGFLATKVQEDSWREVIVFAVGHAHGRQRDELVTKLLRTPLFSFRGRSLEADVTATCCLETASADLAPALMASLQDCAKKLFPPKSIEQARLLAPAANRMPILLKGYSGYDESVVAACIRCASVVGGDEMLEIVETYGGAPGERVVEELLAAWTAFDEKEYFRRVLAKSKEPALEFARGEAGGDIAQCALFLVLRGAHRRAPHELSSQLQRFKEGREVSISDHAGDAQERQYNRPITDIDGARLSKIKSLRKLSLPRCELGALGYVASLPELEELSCSPANPSEIAALGQSQSLRHLTLQGWHLPYHSGKVVEVDLGRLGDCSNLEELNLIGFRKDYRLQLPISKSISDLVIQNQVAALTDLPRLSALRALDLDLDDNGAAVDLALLTSVERLTLNWKGRLSVALAVNLTELWVTGSTEIKILNAAKITRLRDVFAGSELMAALSQQLAREGIGFSDIEQLF